MSLYDNNDFDELILLHLIRSPEIYNKAKKVRLQGDDFLSSRFAGIKLYKTLAELILKLELCPIARSILEIEIHQLVEQGEIDDVDLDTIDKFLTWCYAEELTVSYVNEHLTSFIKHRRFSKLKQETNDTVELYDKLVQADQAIPKTDSALIVDPFDTPVFCMTNSGISTGFTKIDHSLGGGSHQEECGLILAASGSGKTSLGINFAIGGIRTHNVLYVSLEEPHEHLIQRFYANLFQLSYSRLKNGDLAVREELLQNFAARTDIERAMYRRLKIVDGRNLCPITYKGIIELLERSAQEEDFVADVVIVDQLEFMTPAKAIEKGAGKWREYEQISFEIDALSQYRIGNQRPICVWLLHQIQGRPQWEYSYDNIAGFKGIVKPFDVAMGAGRMPGTDFINLHSLKNRHSAPFAHTYVANFAHMRFDESNFQPERDRHNNVVYANKDRPKTKKEREAEPHKEPPYTGRLDLDQLV